MRRNTNQQQGEAAVVVVIFGAAARRRKRCGVWKYNSNQWEELIEYFSETFPCEKNTFVAFYLKPQNRLLSDSAFQIQS